MDGGEVKTVFLSAEERIFKRRVLDSFRTQRETLRWFPIEVERFRLAPDYDFTRPPHSGRLFYEQFDWGMSGEPWRALVREALRLLEPDEKSGRRFNAVTLQSCTAHQ